MRRPFMVPTAAASPHKLGDRAAVAGGVAHLRQSAGMCRSLRLRSGCAERAPHQSCPYLHFQHGAAPYFSQQIAAALDLAVTMDLEREYLLKKRRRISCKTCAPMDLILPEAPARSCPSFSEATKTRLDAAEHCSAMDSPCAQSDRRQFPRVLRAFVCR